MTALVALLVVGGAAFFFVVLPIVGQALKHARPMAEADMFDQTDMHKNVIGFGAAISWLFVWLERFGTQLLNLASRVWGFVGFVMGVLVSLFAPEIRAFLGIA
ncbi:hypothetical protein DEM25_011960 [Oceaniradius stylonematis]|uniref:Uncharacterized protein n=1 Tax=Oceaniradius stylonematis TaxID=2184161 RepID=A0A3A8A7R0_9HYPH|nr:hypothetical protein [Oceaniradius stylonematis]RKF06332.1 hypothetical protein DEM25_011960 [Oceaniradius stylonematis]